MEQADLDCLLQLAAQDQELARFSDAREADEMCGYACDVFLDIVETLLPEMDVGEVHFVAASRLATEKRALSCSSWLLDESPVFSYRQAGHRWYLSGCKSPGHVVARVEDFLIDWTARQFNPDAPFPLVFRLSDIKS